VTAGTVTRFREFGTERGIDREHALAKWSTVSRVLVEIESFSSAPCTLGLIDFSNESILALSSLPFSLSLFFSLFHQREDNARPKGFFLKPR